MSNIRPAKASNNQGGYLRTVQSRFVSSYELHGNQELKTRSTTHMQSKEELESKEIPKKTEDATLKKVVFDKYEDDKDNELVSSDDEENDSEDEEAELLRELEKLKREREEEREKEEEEKRFEDEKELLDQVLTGNPLLNFGPQIKRKWNDDVIFKNQANDEPKLKKRFINDTIRSDFHKKFLYKFIK